MGNFTKVESDLYKGKSLEIREIKGIYNLDYLRELQWLGIVYYKKICLDFDKIFPNYIPHFRNPLFPESHGSELL
jgi:hypothetical protein